MRQKERLIILGTYAFAEEVADLVSDCPEYELVAFAENWNRERCRLSLLGLPILWMEDLPPLGATHLAVCAIGSTRRANFVQHVEKLGFSFATIRHPTARVSRAAAISPGCIISAGVMIAAQTTLGRHVIVNRGSLR